MKDFRPGWYGSNSYTRRHYLGKDGYDLCVPRMHYTWLKGFGLWPTLPKCPACLKRYGAREALESLLAGDEE